MGGGEVERTEKVTFIYNTFSLKNKTRKPEVKRKHWSAPHMGGERPSRLWAAEWLSVHRGHQLSAFSRPSFHVFQVSLTE